MFGKKKVAALVAEFLGTGVLTLIIMSMQRSQLGYPLFVSFAVGLSIAAMTFTLGKSSGGYFNPAITLGLWTARKLSTITSILYIAVQFAGAYAAYGIYAYFINAHVPSLSAHFAARQLVAEAIGTGIFAFAFVSAIYNGYRSATGALFAGLAFAVGVLAISSVDSTALLNPAWAAADQSWSWGTTLLGPVIGAIIGINLYALLFAEPELVEVDVVTVAETPVATATAVTAKSKKASTPKKTSTGTKKTTTKKK
jgi:aquaporin Z